MKDQLKEKIEDMYLELINMMTKTHNEVNAGKRFREMRSELYKFIDENFEEKK